MNSKNSIIKKQTNIKTSNLSKIQNKPPQIKQQNQQIKQQKGPNKQQQIIKPNISYNYYDRINFISLKGKRATNEDNHLIYKNNNYEVYGIFDGHGGKGVSLYLTEIIQKLLNNNAFKIPLRKDNVKNICFLIQNKIKENPKLSIQGSTCLLLFKFDNKFQVINVGDSRCIICSNNKPIQVTRDHKPIDPLEAERIKKMGGKITFDGVNYRINGLSLSRAFGDCETNYTEPFPEIFSKVITNKDKFIILGCDGLYETLDNNTICNFILYNSFDKNGLRINKNINMAEKLGRLAIKNGSEDNVSVIIIYLQ